MRFLALLTWVGKSLVGFSPELGILQSVLEDRKVVIVLHGYGSIVDCCELKAIKGPDGSPSAYECVFSREGRLTITIEQAVEFQFNLISDLRVIDIAAHEFMSIDQTISLSPSRRVCSGVGERLIIDGLNVPVGGLNYTLQQRNTLYHPTSLLSVGSRGLLGRSIVISSANSTIDCCNILPLNSAHDAGLANVVWDGFTLQQELVLKDLLNTVEFHYFDFYTHTSAESVTALTSSIRVLWGTLLQSLQQYETLVLLYGLDGVDQTTLKKVRWLELFEIIPKTKYVRETQLELATQIIDTFYTNNINYRYTVNFSTASTDLLYSWESTANITGRSIGVRYPELIVVQNIGARDWKFSSTMDYMVRSQKVSADIPDFKEFLKTSIWGTVEPGYMRLHCLVRYKLQGVYGTDLVPFHVSEFFDAEGRQNGKIPLQLLHSPLGDSWLGSLGLVGVQVTKNALVFSSTRALHSAIDSFLRSLEFGERLPPPSRVLFEEYNRQINGKCSNNIHSYSNNSITMYHCTYFTVMNVSHPNFLHYQYSDIMNGFILQLMYYSNVYSNQSLALRGLAHPALTHAIAGVYFSAFKQRKLVDPKFNSTEFYNATLDSVMDCFYDLPTLPFCVAFDVWRSAVDEMKYQDVPSVSDLNDLWWKMRIIYQGVSRPSKRDAIEFDAGVCEELVHNRIMFPRALGIVMKYQILSHICSLMKKELQDCDFGAAIVNANITRTVIRLMDEGRKNSLSSSLLALAGESTIRTGPMLAYYSPFMSYAGSEISRLQEQSGFFHRVSDCGWDLVDRKPVGGQTLNDSTSTFQLHSEGDRTLGEIIPISICGFLAFLLIVLKLLTMSWKCNRTQAEAVCDLESM